MEFYLGVMHFGHIVLIQSSLRATLNMNTFSCTFKCLQYDEMYVRVVVYASKIAFYFQRSNQVPPIIERD